MLKSEKHKADQATLFAMEIATAPPGKKLQLVVFVHSNFGIGAPHSVDCSVVYRALKPSHHPSG